MSSRKATESFCFVHTMQYIYKEDNKSALESLGWQATFKFQALWSVRDGKGLMKQLITCDILGSNSSVDEDSSIPCRPSWPPNTAVPVYWSTQYNILGDLDQLTRHIWAKMITTERSIMNHSISLQVFILEYMPLKFHCSPCPHYIILNNSPSTLIFSPSKRAAPQVWLHFSNCNLILDV